MAATEAHLRLAGRLSPTQAVAVALQTGLHLPVAQVEQAVGALVRALLPIRERLAQPTLAAAVEAAVKTLGLSPMAVQAALAL
jgi:hypothetical protein